MQLDCQGQGSYDGNSRRTPHPHGFDAIEGLLACGHLVVVVLMRQSQLVQHVQPAASVFDGLQVGHIVQGRRRLGCETDRCPLRIVYAE